MTSMNKRSFLLRSLVVGALAMGGTTWAQAANDWPVRPVSILVGYSPGGPTDVIARVLAEQLSAKFNQSFVVENKAGAGGVVAAALLKNAAPDGYTLMLGSSGTLTIAPTLQKNLPYDTIRDFTPIGLVASYPYLLVTSTSSGITTLEELISRGRDPSSRLNFASAGNGAVNHLAGEWFKHDAKINAAHVPYKGDSAAVSDLAAGRVDFAFLAAAAVKPHIDAGRLRVLASGSATPGRGGEGVVTLGERFKGFVAEPWNGLMGPAGVPEPIVTKLNAAINEIMNRKDVVDRLATMAQYPFTGTPQDFTNHIQAETGRWASIIETSNIKVE